MKTSDTEIKEQSKFCCELANRLTKRVIDYNSNDYVNNHTQIQADIKRLRRELLALYKMFNYWS